MNQSKPSLKITSIIFAICVFILGFQHIYFGKINPALFPRNFEFVPLFVYSTGAVFMLCGTLSLFRKHGFISFLTVGMTLMLSFLFGHIPAIIKDFKNANEWTAAFETLTISCGAFLLAGENYGARKEKKAPPVIYKMIKLLFAASLGVFGCLHMMYADFIANLIPSWIPFHLFWAYFVGLAFFAASISLLIGVHVRLAMGSLGCMFLFWVCFVHFPRVINHINNRDEWSSLLIALIFSNIAFTLAITFNRPNNYSGPIFKKKNF